MGIFIRLNESFDNQDLPLLRNDPALSDGSLFLYDLLDEGSWPSQAAPAATSTVFDLAENANATTEGVIGWERGFLFDGASQDDALALPTSSRLSTDVEGYGLAFWYKPKSLDGTLKGIVSCGRGGDGYNNTQYSIHRSDDKITLYANKESVTGLDGYPIALGNVYHFAVTIEKTGAQYLSRLWVNGVVYTQKTSSAPMADALSTTRAKFGKAESLFSGSDDFVLFRAHGDSLSTRTAEQFVAADFAAGLGRFS